ncbi:MAG: hypothetical protein KGI73_00005 [Patescibacteria group bacterium]|nr:hypothetical protein [Patescibacteria group bacterium]
MSEKHRSPYTLIQLERIGQRAKQYSTDIVGGKRKSLKEKLGIRIEAFKAGFFLPSIDMELAFLDKNQRSESYKENHGAMMDLTHHYPVSAFVGMLFGMPYGLGHSMYRAGAAIVRGETGSSITWLSQE